jgi:hydroxymethylglutaryl-CoA synthase
VVEVKQACYASTAALQLAKDYVFAHPDKRALVVASDVAWYGLESAGEVTQGAGAIAMIVKVNPKLAVIEGGSPFVVNNEDFYRPSHQEVPIVDGKLSIRSYRDVMLQVIGEQKPTYMCFHMPFAMMANKASQALPQPIPDEVLVKVKALNKVVGNIYNGSLYLSLLSLLTHHEGSLAHETVGMFAYGSGATGEYFKLVIQETYREGFDQARILSDIDNRDAITINVYEHYMQNHAQKDIELEMTITDFQHNRSPFRLTHIRRGHRYYAENK